MIIKGSSQKRHRQSEKRRLRNKSVRSSVRTSAKRVLDAVKNQDRAEAETAYRSFVSLIDSAVSKGVVHKNACARKKSRLAQKVNALQ